MKDPLFKGYITLDLSMCRYTVHLSINNLINELFKVVRESICLIKEDHNEKDYPVKDKRLTVFYSYKILHRVVENFPQETYLKRTLEK